MEDKFENRRIQRKNLSLLSHHQGRLVSRTKKYRMISNKLNKSSTHHRKEIIVLLLIFAGSLLIRMIGLNHGFPLLTHPDESAIINPVVMMTEKKILNPGDFIRPDQILYFLNYFYLNALSFLHFGENIAVTFQENELFFYYYARLLIAMMGALIPVIAYLISKQFNRKLAFISALVFAFFPAYFVHSAYITPDVPITLFTLLVIYFTLRYLKINDKKSIYLATIFAAINTAEKYPGLISLLIVFLGILLKHMEENKTIHKINWGLIRKLIFFSLFFIFVLFLVAPNIFLEYKSVIEAIIHDARSTHPGADNLPWYKNMLFYVEQFYGWSNFLSIPLIVFGIIRFIQKQDSHAFILTYGFLYWILLSILPLHWERWALPMYITPLFLIAGGILFLMEKTDRLKIAKMAIIFVIAVYFFHQGTASLYFPIRMSFTDTRVIAQEYCQQNQITVQNSIYEGYSPLLPTYPKGIFNEYPVEDQVEYVILSSQMNDRYFAEPEHYPDEIDFYENIRQENVLVIKFQPIPQLTGITDRLNEISYFIRKQWDNHLVDKIKGPVIEIYKIRK